MLDQLMPVAPPSLGVPIVLIVDDEPTVLDTLTHQLRRDYQIVTAVDGNDALRVLAAVGPVAAVVSDMRMPDMDGVELLGRIQLAYPDTTRILHTAQADLTCAISAINDGGVFRFLCKPCPTDDLRRTVREAVERHAQATTERQLLDKTLRASLQALFGCLELASPTAFARAGRIRTLVTAMCQELSLSNLWQIEVAAMASQLGAVTIPPTVLHKLDRGLPLTDDERAMVDAMPAVAAQLLGNVPMLHDIVEIIHGLAPAPRRPVGARPPSPVVAIAVAVLRVAMDFETLESRGIAVESALAILECQHDRALEILLALRKVKGHAAIQDTIKALKIAELEVGMRIAEDIVAANGLVLIGRGMVVTEVLLDRLTNFKRTIKLTEPVLASIPAAMAAR
jgi:CheY-like chemotaxis protein